MEKTACLGHGSSVPLQRGRLSNIRAAFLLLLFHKLLHLLLLSLELLPLFLQLLSLGSTDALQAVSFSCLHRNSLPLQAHKVLLALHLFLQ